MKDQKLDDEILKRIEELVAFFDSNEELFSGVLVALNGYISLSKKLKPYVHTIKSRLKDHDNLRNKLIRKAKEALSEGKVFDIDKENFFLRINDLAGFRIIHLHTKQFEQIDKHLKAILKEQQWEIIEGPIAKTWDDESRGYFSSISIATEPNKNMYTSVHYIIKPNSRVTCEIQVRTLMEEVWGEVDHSINYPEQTECFSCREQIKALARSTSSCSRLVDSIFSTYEDFLKAESSDSLTKPKKAEVVVKVSRAKRTKRKQLKSMIGKRKT
jgi:putative GTP pyrophosphokinase